MSYKLIIAEKPSLGRAINDYLVKNSISGYKVTWLFGHMLELLSPEQYDEKWKSWDINLLPIKPIKFELQIKKDDGIEKQVNLVKNLLDNANGVINAGDPDREGQLLVDELLEHFNNTKPVERLWLAAIDDKSIEKALSSIKNNSEYKGYKLAAETRSQADWLVGMNYSRALTSVFKAHGYSTISIGRVQTPTLKLIVDRDKEVKNFKSKDFYELIATFIDNEIIINARLILPESIKNLLDDENRLLDKSSLEIISNSILNKNGIVSSYLKDKKSTRQPLLFNLSELQAYANKKLGLSAQEVLETAQTLYENKLTSYPRSDCQYMPDSQFNDSELIFRELVKLEEFKKLSPNKTIKSAVWNDDKVSAHHGIVPTGQNLSELSKLNDNCKNLFNVIALRYLMQFYPALEFEQVELIIDVEKYQFKAIGKTIINLGWKNLVTDIEEDETDAENDKVLLPILNKGQSLLCNKPEIVTKKTQKPKFYTEGTLIQAMQNIHNKIADIVKSEGYDAETTLKLIKEYKASLKETAGLGTEATRAQTIETLKKRGFIVTNKKSINSTEVGELVIDTLNNDPLIKAELGFLSSPLTTAKYEQYLDEIQNNSGKPEILLNNLYGKLEKLKTFANLKFNLPISKDVVKCLSCNDGILILLKGQYGKFWKCKACNDNFKDLNNKPQIIQKDATNNKTLRKDVFIEDCPKCKTGKVFKKENKGNENAVLICTGYPKKCSYFEITNKK